MVDPLARRILEHIGDRRYSPRKVRELAQDLGIAEEETETFRSVVEELEELGHLVLSGRDAVSLPPPGREMIGSFRLTSRGFGFIIPENPLEHRDLFVPPGNTGDALTGDRVRAVIRHERGRAGGGRSPYVGQIVEILQRSDRRYVGNLARKGPVFVVDPDNQALARPILIRDPHARNAKLGDKVVVELLVYPEDDKLGEGVISEVLGEAGLPDVETLSVMRAYGLPDRFSEEVLEAARIAAAAFDQDAVPPDREDLTGTFICTIDPPDARDFDDAISIVRLDPQTSGGAAYELGIHIADVANYVTPGTALDDEAKKRGNSVYLPRLVVPMLPELLSNGVCSLQEGVNRLTKSALIRYDEDGHVLSRRFSNSVIRSAKRLTYLEAQALIDNDLREAVKHARSEPKYPRELKGTLALMNELAHKIRQRRLDAGMIVLGLPEVELIFDEGGNVIDAVPEDNAFTHTIIEMFMVEANEAVASLFDALGLPMIRRTHDDPPVHDVEELRQFARVAGHNIPANPTRLELQQLLDAVRGKPAQQAVHLAVLKTLAKAVYSPQDVGHFALASEDYTHFTSPIRRYPDLIVHRALDAYFENFPDHRKRALPPQRSRKALARKLQKDPRLPGFEPLVEIGRHCSATEQNAAAAERELRSYLVLELLARHLGDDYNGTVTGVSNQGLYIQLDKYLVDGMVRINDLPGMVGSPGDPWRLNRATGALVAQRSGRTIAIGTRFVVRISKVDPVHRQLDLVIVGQIVAAREGEGREKVRRVRSASSPRKQPRGAAKAHGKAMALKKQQRKRGPRRKR